MFEPKTNSKSSPDHPKWNSGNMKPFFRAVVQPKLTVNTPGDAYEQEADQVADQVMRMREGDAPVVQRMPLTPLGGLQRKCTECEKEEKEKVQRKESGGGDAGGVAAVDTVLFEVRRDGIADDTLGGGVVQRTFEPVADLDA